MASGDSRAAEALAAFALSSPDPSDFGSSPAGSALRKARNDCERVFLAAFEGSPSSHGESSPARDGPAKTSSLHPTPVRLSRAIHEEQIPSQEQSLLQKIAESLEEDAGSAESANDLLSDDFEDANSDSSDGEVPSPIELELELKNAQSTGRESKTTTRGRGLSPKHAGLFGHPPTQASEMSTRNKAVDPEQDHTTLVHKRDPRRSSPRPPTAGKPRQRAP